MYERPKQTLTQRDQKFVENYINYLASKLSQYDIDMYLFHNAVRNYKINPLNFRLEEYEIISYGGRPELYPELYDQLVAIDNVLAKKAELESIRQAQEADIAAAKEQSLNERNPMRHQQNQG